MIGNLKSGASPIPGMMRVALIDIIRGPVVEVDCVEELDR